MTLTVIGAGVGRTGTYSLKAALEALDFGPCHHMEEVLQQMAVQTPLWTAANKGRPDWQAIYRGYRSAVDWPTATFYRELHAAYPDARFVLTVRSPESWAASFSETIYTLLARRADAPPEMRDWLRMAADVIELAGFPDGLSPAQLADRFVAHNDAVKAAIPADRLLVFEVKDGWGPLCDFLGVAAPGTPFPRTNDRKEFWELVNGNR